MEPSLCQGAVVGRVVGARVGGETFRSSRFHKGAMNPEEPSGSNAEAPFYSCTEPSSSDRSDAPVRRRLAINDSTQTCISLQEVISRHSAGTNRRDVWRSSGRTRSWPAVPKPAANRGPPTAWAARSYDGHVSTVELPDDVAAALAEAAEQRGVSADQLAAEILAGRLGPRRRKLSFVGIGASDTGRSAAEAEDLLREGGFGTDDADR